MKKQSKITEDCIVSGLGGLDRQELAGMIALIENAKFSALAQDAAGKIANKFNRAEKDSTFAARVTSAADKIETCADDTNILRHRLWCLLRGGLGLNPSLPLAERTIRRDSVAMGKQIAVTLSPKYRKRANPAKWNERAYNYLKRGLGFTDEKDLEFGTIVEMEATQLLGNLLKQDKLDNETKESVLKEVRAKFEDLPHDLKDEDLRKAVASGDAKVIGAALAGGALGGLALGVELAGFSAYILAAQASAFLPLIGGKAAVSLLAVLANPAFVILALGLGGWYTVANVGSAARSGIATRIVVLLALKGLASRRNGVAIVLNDFRSIDANSASAWKHLSEPERRRIPLRRKRIDELVGQNLPELAGDAPPPWNKRPGGLPASALEAFLGKEQGGHFDVLATGALTAGDLLYTIWSVDPMVIQAADFSRTVEIDDVFMFSGFAERWSKMSEDAAGGLESSLQGYTAEQLVLARLVEDGHVVELADTSNMPGHDVVVDGVPFQVKCGSPDNRSMLSDHFEKYPDIPVIANAELALAVSNQAWASKVFAVEGFDLVTVQSMMNGALEAAAALDDLPVPFYAVIVGVARNLKNLKDGRMALADLPAELAVTAAVKGALAAIGAKAGSFAGLIFLGPAGAIILGPAVGVMALLGASRARQTLEALANPEWSRTVVDEAVKLKELALSALDDRLRLLELDPASQAAQSEIEFWLCARRLDEKIAAAEQRVEIEEQPVDCLTDAIELLGKVIAVQVFDQDVRDQQTSLILTLAEKPTHRDTLRKGSEKIRSGLERFARDRKARS